MAVSHRILMGVEAYRTCYPREVVIQILTYNLKIFDI